MTHMLTVLIYRSWWCPLRWRPVNGKGVTLPLAFTKPKILLLIISSNMYASLMMGNSFSARQFLQLSSKQQHQSNNCISKQLTDKVQTLGLVSRFITIKQLIFYPDDIFIRPFRLLVHARDYKQKKVKTVLITCN